MNGTCVWHAAQGSNPDLSVLEADALSVELATQILLAEGRGVEPPTLWMLRFSRPVAGPPGSTFQFGGRCRSRTCPTQCVDELAIRCLKPLGQPTCGGRDRNCTYKLLRGVDYSHLGPLHCPTHPLILVRRPGLEPGSAGLKARCFGN